MRLVIDNDVARQAAPSAQTTVAVACAEALVAVRETRGLRAIFGPALLREWGVLEGSPNAATEFAMTWYAAMLEEGRTVDFDDRAHPDFVAARERFPKVGQAGLEHDAHLVNAALHHDRRIVSCEGEKALRGWLKRLNAEGHLGELYFARPVHADCCKWLRFGAPDHADFAIAPTPKKKPAAKPVSSKRTKEL
jgi:hypothetical protein